MLTREDIVLLIFGWGGAMFMLGMAIGIVAGAHL